MTQKCLTIALLGVPNAGKSSLLNAIVGERLAAVHRKPQMTRRNLLGLMTEGDTQLIFIDTPGLHDRQATLNKKMHDSLMRAIDEADLVLVLLEVHRETPELLLQQMESVIKQKPILIAVNKCDKPQRDWVLDLNELKVKYLSEAMPISALNGVGVRELVEALKLRAKEHPFYYDPDDLTTSSLRDLAADTILEQVMEFLHDEIPYEIRIEIESYEDLPKKAAIRAVIIVNRDSQKGMVIGKRGSIIEKIRQESERKFAKIAGKPVKMNLFVKVEAGWIKE